MIQNTDLQNEKNLFNTGWFALQVKIWHLIRPLTNRIYDILLKRRG